jgi:hypothetical protein
MTEISQDRVRTELTHQTRHLLLMAPFNDAVGDIGRQVRAGRQGDGDAIVRSIDFRYLALSCLDHVIEGAALDFGIRPDDLVAHLVREITYMAPHVEVDIAEWIADLIVDHIGNRRDRNLPFRPTYFDAGERTWRETSFWLIELSRAPDGSLRWRSSQQAHAILLEMLIIPDDFAYEAEARMIRKAIERGRFDDARLIADRAKRRSVEMKQWIQDRLTRIRRAPDSVNWSGEVIPMLDEARQHLSERQEQDTAIIESVRNHFAEVRGDADRAKLLSLRRTMEECKGRHADLFFDVVKANDEFRELQTSVFRARRRLDVPDLERAVLLPMAQLPIGDLAAASDRVWASFFPPSQEVVFDLPTMFERLCMFDVAEDAAVEEEEGDTYALAPVPDRYDHDTVEKGTELSVRLSAGGTDLAGLIRRARGGGARSDEIEVAIVSFLATWSTEGAHRAFVEGSFDDPAATGDNLALHAFAEGSIDGTQIAPMENQDGSVTENGTKDGPQQEAAA